MSEANEVGGVFKWNWMMDFCKKHRLPPAQEWAWKSAEHAYDNYCRELPGMWEQSDFIGGQTDCGI